MELVALGIVMVFLLQRFFTTNLIIIVDVIILLLLVIIIIITRSYAALLAADLDWIVGPGYSSGGYILGCSQRLAFLSNAAVGGPN